MRYRRRSEGLTVPFNSPDPVEPFVIRKVSLRIRRDPDLGLGEFKPLEVTCLSGLFLVAFAALLPGTILSFNIFFLGEGLAWCIGPIGLMIVVALKEGTSSFNAFLAPLWLTAGDDSPLLR